MMEIDATIKANDQGVRILGSRCTNKIRTQIFTNFHRYLAFGSTYSNLEILVLWARSEIVGSACNSFKE